jgi:hypothetical protein
MPLVFDDLGRLVSTSTQRAEWWLQSIAGEFAPERLPLIEEPGAEPVGTSAKPVPKACDTHILARRGRVFALR